MSLQMIAQFFLGIFVSRETIKDKSRNFSCYLCLFHNVLKEIIKNV